MKRPAVILVFGLVASIVAFACFYLVGTASSRALMREPQPELAWLKKEFNLNEAEFKRIVELHEGYLPGCAERCRLIEEQNERLQKLLAQSEEVTPEVEAVIAERARLRTECESEMLKHFIQVSRTMPEVQGKRYLAWVEQQTFLRGEAMEQRHKTGNHPDAHSHQHHQH